MPLIIAQSICKFNYEIVENYPSLGVNISSVFVYSFQTHENSVFNTFLLFFIFILIEINIKLWSHDNDDMIINFNFMFPFFIHSLRR